MVVTKVKAPDRNQDEIGKLNDSPNKCVFSLLLSDSTFSAAFTVSGSWFHRLGPPTAKEHSPIITVLAGGGTMRRQCVDDRRHRLDELRCSNWKYRQGHAHAVPCRTANNV